MVCVSMTQYAPIRHFRRDFRARDRAYFKILRRHADFYRHNILKLINEMS